MLTPMNSMEAAPAQLSARGAALLEEARHVLVFVGVVVRRRARYRVPFAWEHGSLPSVSQAHVGTSRPTPHNRVETAHHATQHRTHSAGTRLFIYR